MTSLSDSDVFSRRAVLRAGAVAMAASAAFSLSPLGRVLADTLAQDDFALFMAISQPLCGQQVLDPALGRVLFAALSQGNPDFTRLLAPFKQWLAERGQATRNLTADISAQHKELALVPALITRAWYLGVVGNQAYAYEQALMYPPIKDMVVLPTYARGAPGYWEAKPYPLPAN